MASRRRLTAAVLMAVTVGTVLVGPIPAAATTGHHAGPPDAFTGGGGPVTVIGSAVASHGPGRAGLARVINCWGQSDNPHNSSGTPSAVTGKARTWCDAPVTQIEAQAELYRYLDGYGYTVVGFGPLGYELNNPGPVTSTAYDICQGRPTAYITLGRHKVIFPPGFQPQSAQVYTQAAASVDC